MKKRKIERAIAVMTVFLFEMLATAVLTALLGTLIIPLVYIKRGYYAVGGEWMFLMVFALVAYHLMHWRLFASVEKRGQEKWTKQMHS